MASVKKMFKDIKVEHVLGIVGLVFLLYALYQYSQNKNLFQSGMTGGVVSSTKETVEKTVDDIKGIVDDVGAPIGDAVNNVVNKPGSAPSDLLPKDSGAWASMNPSSSLEGVSLLDAKQVVGINTQGSSLRNANLQLRSEPPNPRMNTNCPWNISTIESDNIRKPLEIGTSTSA